jgi:hypothetical protein
MWPAQRRGVAASDDIVRTIVSKPEVCATKVEKVSVTVTPSANSHNSLRCPPS